MARQVDHLLKREVTRKEFLTISGFGLASLFGFGTVVKLLTGHDIKNSFKTSRVGYGSSAYGGSKNVS